MNSKQLSVLWIGISLVALAGLIPPWKNGDMASLFYYPTDLLDLKKLLIEWFVICVVAVGWIYTLQNAEPLPPTDSPKQIPRAAWLGPLIACSLGFFAYISGETAKNNERAAAEKKRQEELAAEQKRLQAEQALEQRAIETRHALALKLSVPRNFGTKQTEEGLTCSLVLAMTGDDTVSYKLSLPVPEGVHYFENVTLDLEDKDGFSIIKRSFLWSGGFRSGSFTCDPSTYQRIAGWNLEKGLSGPPER